MTRIVRYDPFQEFRRMVWSPMWADNDLIASNGADSLNLDVYEEGDAVVVIADIPSVEPDDVDVTVTSDSVTIKAERKEEAEEKREKLYSSRAQFWLICANNQFA